MVLITIALVVGAGTASQAGATPPTKQTQTFTSTGVFKDCGGETLLTSTATDVVTQITFFDSNGNPVKIEFHISEQGVITNSSSGNQYPESGNWMIVIDPTNPSEQAAAIGVVFMINVPGLGAVLQDTGKIAFDSNGNLVFVAGPHQLFFGDPDPCSVLI